MKDKTMIPKGFYCYSVIDGERVQCPYWSRLKDGLYQEDGYCSFLEQGDWDINEKAGMLTGWRSDGKPLPPVSAHEIKMSLLWDECKECDVNMEDEDDNFTS
ncbi:MAG: hypothetical protein WC196_05855 [Bacilli bacterium]